MKRDEVCKILDKNISVELSNFSPDKGTVHKCKTDAEKMGELLAQVSISAVRMSTHAVLATLEDLGLLKFDD